MVINTALIGKWHLKKEPSGFDYYKVLPGQGKYNNPVFKTKGKLGRWIQRREARTRLFR